MAIEDRRERLRIALQGGATTETLGRDIDLLNIAKLEDAKSTAAAKIKQGNIEAVIKSKQAAYKDLSDKFADIIKAQIGAQSALSVQALKNIQEANKQLTTYDDKAKKVVQKLVRDQNLNLPGEQQNKLNAIRAAVVNQFTKGDASDQNALRQMLHFAAAEMSPPRTVEQLEQELIDTSSADVVDKINNARSAETTFNKNLASVAREKNALMKEVGRFSGTGSLMRALEKANFSGSGVTPQDFEELNATIDELNQSELAERRRQVGGDVGQLISDLNSEPQVRRIIDKYNLNQRQRTQLALQIATGSERSLERFLSKLENQRLEREDADFAQRREQAPLERLTEEDMAEDEGFEAFADRLEQQIASERQQQEMPAEETAMPADYKSMAQIKSGMQRLISQMTKDRGGGLESLSADEMQMVKDIFREQMFMRRQMGEIDEAEDIDSLIEYLESTPIDRKVTGSLEGDPGFGQTLAEQDEVDPGSSSERLISDTKQTSLEAPTPQRTVSEILESMKDEPMSMEQSDSLPERSSMVSPMLDARRQSLMRKLRPEMAGQEAGGAASTINMIKPKESAVAASPDTSEAQAERIRQANKKRKNAMDELGSQSGY